MKFLQHCGQCPKWKDDWCSKFQEARHSKRELCDDVWDKEIKRLALLGGLDGVQTYEVLKEGKTLDPKRTIEARPGFIEWQVKAAKPKKAEKSPERHKKKD